MREGIATEVESLVARVRAQTDLPIAVGFGISKPEHVQDVCRYADGAVVGTRLVLEIEQHLTAPDLVERVAQLVRELRGA
jgi:tryptophan synthase alpha chain